MRRPRSPCRILHTMIIHGRSAWVGSKSSPEKWQAIHVLLNAHSCMHKKQRLIQLKLEYRVPVTGIVLTMGIGSTYHNT